MKLFNNANSLTGTVLAALACVAFVGCTDSSDRAATTSSTTSSTTTAPVDSTVSNTTIAADDTPKTLDTTGEVPPAAADTASGSDSAMPADSSTTSETKTTKKMKHKAKKAHKKHSAWVAPTPVINDSVATNSDDDFSYDNDVAVTETESMDVSDQYHDETLSGSTMAPETYRETGLSPFAQEPNSRMPKQIGSGQLTGEDKSTTVLEGPSLFQDPAALGRDLIR